MSNYCAFRLSRFVRRVAILAWIGSAPIALAQEGQWKAASDGLIPMLGLETLTGQVNPQNTNDRTAPPRRAPLAYLVENPDQTDGASPYALTDQSGTIQRYVEPVPGIDLTPHIGEVVVVRHDTGPTLLASQLELPNQPLYPMVGERGAGRFNDGPSYTRPRRTPYGGGIEQAAYVDNDDASVQLLPEEMPLPGHSSHAGGHVAPLPMMNAGAPCYPDQMMMPGPGGPGCNSQYCDPVYVDPYGMQAYPGQMMSPYPQYGGNPISYQYGQQAPCNTCNTPTEPQRAHLSADVEFLFLRPRITSETLGKLSETYEFSPRFILEARNGGNLDVRARYWHYGRDVNLLNDDDIRLEFDVLDLEFVHRIEGRRSDLALAAGLRLAHLQLTDTFDERCGSDMVGLTAAADGLVQLGCFRGGYCGWVYGGRFSLLGGDWDGDDSSEFISSEVSDDNVVVSELYTGVEVARRCGNMNVGGRLLFEIAGLAERCPRDRCRHRVDRLSRPRVANWR